MAAPGTSRGGQPIRKKKELLLLILEHLANKLVDVKIFRNRAIHATFLTKPPSP